MFTHICMSHKNICIIGISIQDTLQLHWEDGKPRDADTGSNALSSLLGLLHRTSLISYRSVADDGPAIYRLVNGVQDKVQHVTNRFRLR